MSAERLLEIQSEIRLQNTSLKAHMARSLDCILAIGELLQEAKALVQCGKWADYCRSSYDMEQTTISLYIRCHTHRQILLEHNPKGIIEAKLCLREHLPSYIESRGYPKAIRQEVIRRHKGGETDTSIAKAMELDRGTVRVMRTTPDKKLANERRRHATRTAYQRWEKRKANEAAIKSGGTAQVSVAYQRIRQAVEALDRAYRTDDDPDGDIPRALRALYRAEDLIVKVSKTAKQEVA